MAQLPTQSEFGDYSEWPGRDVLDSGGQRLGGVREIYLDRETGRPEWVLVDVDEAGARFVPLADASVEGRTIRVAHDASTIRSAPGIGAEPRIDESEERRLYSHYGLGYSEQASGSGLPAEEPPAQAQPTGWGEGEQSERASGGESAAYSSPPGETASSTPPSGDTAAYALGDEDNDDASTAGSSDAAESPATASWSAAAEPTNDAPPPAEPPSPDELESAQIPEPPAASDRAADYGSSSEGGTPLFSAATGDTTATDSAPPSPGTDAESVAGSVSPLITDDADHALPPVDQGELPPAGTTSGPDVPQTDPALSPHAAPPETPATPSWTSSTSSGSGEESGGGPLAALKARPQIAAAGLGAAVLFFIIRRLR